MDRLTGALSVLRAYTQLWTESPNRKHSFDIPVHTESVTSATAFEKYLGPIYALPFFYRLAFLKQLSTVPFSTHLDATHTRLSHALGATKVAARLLDTIRAFPSVNGPNPPADGLMDQACVFYSFIHDSFHGPMGHSLDLMKDIFGKDLEYKLDVGYLRAALGNDATALTGVRQQLSEAAEKCRPGEGARLLEGVQLLTATPVLQSQRPDLFFLRDVVDSEIDADRLDYLQRDGTVLLDWGGRELHKLVETARVVQVRTASGPLNRLAYSVKFKLQVAELLRLRRRLYSEHYEATKKLIVDDMICHAVFYTLRDLGVVDDERGPLATPVASEIIERIMLLTDEDLFPALYEMGIAPPAGALVERVRRHEHYVEVFTQQISFSHREELGKSLKACTDDISVCTQRLAAAEGADDWHRIRNPAHREEFARIANGRLGTTEELVHAYQSKVNGKFLLKHGVEKRAWKALVQKDSDGKNLLTFIAKEYGDGAIDRDVEYRSQFERYPPLHLTTTSRYRVSSEADMTLYQTEGPASAAVFYDDTTPSSPTITQERISADISKSFQSYPFVVSAPATLVEAFKPERIRDAVVEELRTHWWFYSAW